MGRAGILKELLKNNLNYQYFNNFQLVFSNRLIEELFSSRGRR